MAIKSSNQITFTEHKKIVEIKEWYLATSNNSDVTIDTDGWTTDIRSVDYNNKYLWNYEEIIYSIGSPDISEPVIIGFYGKGIANITNYYQISTTPEMPSLESVWVIDAPVLTPINKYLWNYEAITYTDGSIGTTNPVIIGVYGDSGYDAVVFEIYSTNGFMFKEETRSIELKIAAFHGSNTISNATYSWYWWDESLNNGTGDYSMIHNDVQTPSLVVNANDVYALTNLKCVMLYDGKTYEDYVTLTNETVVYNAVVKFFNGSNIFSSMDSYLIAYIDLYQNNHLIETVPTKAYFSGIVTVSNSGVITVNSEIASSDGDKMFFVYKDGNGLYQVVLGKYTSGVWTVEESTTSYSYVNSLYPENKSNVFAISKESINKSQNIDFTIYKDNTYISSTSAMVIDINDPIVSHNEPSNPFYNQLWLDTSLTPSSLKIFVQVEGQDYGEWIDCTEHLGKDVYTSKPSKYSVDDLWILSSGETCGEFGPGSMLKAIASSNTFNVSHWIDADEEYTELKNNIQQYFGFDPNTGLRIGQSDNKFYVNISSSEMGFYDNSNGQNQKVVSIGNNAATIKNLTVEDDAEFNCNAAFSKQIQFGNFVWQTESNGSLSLAVMK